MININNIYMLYQNDTIETPLIKALIQNESADRNYPNGNDRAIGDIHLPDPAYGALQIRQPCVDDVNRANGTHYVAKDMLGNRALSIWVFNKYMDLYATEARLGRPVTDEDRARIWNGGPNGWKTDMTVAYWNNAKEKMA